MAFPDTEQHLLSNQDSHGMTAAFARWPSLTSTGLVLWRDCLSTLKIVFHGQGSLPGLAPQNQLLQLKYPNLYSKSVISNLTLFFGHKWMIARVTKIIN